MHKSGMGCGCALGAQPSPYYAPMTEEEAMRRQEQYAQLRRSRHALLDEVGPAKPLHPAKARPNWGFIAGLVWCVMIWGAVGYMVFHG